MKKVLITGATGFVGSHLIENLLGKGGYDIHGTCKWRSDMSNVLNIQDKIKWHNMELTDAHSVQEVVRVVAPDVVFHLAAQSYVPFSWVYPARTFEINCIGSIHLFEALRRHAPQAVCQIASSSEIYGIPENLPITEKHLPRPCSPYGCSKYAMDRLAAQYYYSYKVKIVITRGFNHTGPRRGEDFVCSSFAKQIAEIEKNKRKPIIKVGNLDARRDFTDVRDIIEAYILATEKCKYGEPYNVCSGNITSIEDVLTQLILMSGTKVTIEEDPKRMRPSDLHTLQGDSTKFKKATSWSVKIPFRQTLRDLLDFWRGKV